MSTRACPSWPDLMEIAPSLQFRHYSLREAQLPTDAFVRLEGFPRDTLSLCCDLGAHVYNPEHTDPAIVYALRGTHWTDLHDRVHHEPSG